jgi:endonuclease YncB( thermonuclease family)
MANLRIGQTTWLLAPERPRMLPRSRPTSLGVFARAGAVAAAALAFVLGAAQPGPAGMTPTEYQATSNSGKLTARVPRGGGSFVPEPEVTGATGVQESILDPFRPVLLAPAQKLAARSTIPASSGFVREVVPRTAGEWTEEEFARVTVVDGRTLDSGSVQVRLIGLDLPLPDQVCRTLDGRLEACSARAATQLELLTRHRRVTCHYRVEGVGEAIGRCRIGLQDLTERMIRTGYAWQTAARPGSTAQ